LRFGYGFGVGRETEFGEDCCEILIGVMAFRCVEEGKTAEKRREKQREKQRGKQSWELKNRIAFFGHKQTADFGLLS